MRGAGIGFVDHNRGGGLSLFLTGANVHTKLRLNTNRRGDARTQLVNIHTYSNLHSIEAKITDLRGELTTKGLSKLLLGDLTNEAWLN